MVGMTLKRFQTKCINSLLDATSVGLKKEVLVQAPTGSGKTIILINYIDEYLKDDNQTIFIWLTPGKGDLEEQSRKKMMKYVPSLNTKDLSDVLMQGFEAGDTAFINWETITKKGNNAIKEAERKNLFERIDEAHNLGYKFIIIIDEEHLNKTIKADVIIQYINADYIIRVSATTKTNKEAEYIEISELDVISEGLITKALYINEGVTHNSVLDDEHSYLLDLAINKQKVIRKEYVAKDIDVNPLIIVQMPNNSAEFIKKVEKILEERGYTYKNKSVAKWLADSKENIDNIENNEAEPIILIMKQAIATGWDCPRAKILVKLRDNMSEDFETQTIGRIRRMPQAKHYSNILLDNCYLYTFDTKYSESVKQELGSNASDVKLLFLKKEYKDFSLTKEFKNNQNDGMGDREAFQVIYNYFVSKYKLTNNKKQNEEILKNNEYMFGNR
jgi:type III restriction enzyme